MMNSPRDEITGRHAPAGPVAVVLGAAGALIALLLGLLTFGVQATARPDGLPLAVGATDPAMAPIASRVAAQGGGEVSWRTAGSREEAERLLDRKEVYGALLFSAGQGGPTATVLLSGAVNPTGAQVAQAVLTQVAGTVIAAARAQVPGAPASPAPPVQVVTVHPASAAGRTLPLAAGALLWLATMITSVLAVVAAPRLRGGRPLGRPALLLAAATSALLGTGVVVGLARLWDPGLAFGWDAIGFLALVGAAFALLQTGVLRWLGVRGLAVLVPLYLMAPAVAGTAPELLDPIYRAALWTWTPFRFATEALRSLLFLGPDAPDVAPALWVFAGIGLAGLLLALAPRHRRDGVHGVPEPVTTGAP
jgi:hypothetical protein